MESKNKLLWMWIRDVFKNSDTVMWKLIREFNNDINKIYSLDAEDLKGSGLRKEAVSGLLNKDLTEVEKIYHKCEKFGIKVVCFDDEDYPYMLKNIYDPPPVIYVKGDLKRLKNKLVIAGIGTRKPNAYGAGIARKIASELAARDVVVVSGMASGIDSAVHTGALDVDGITVAVLGTAIDKIYPANNFSIYKKASETGVVISEHPPQARSYATDFLRRNRIIAGMSHGVFICQAPERSGSLNTARLALDSGRDVFCVAGNAEELNEGGNRLIIDGNAKLILDAEGILEEYSALNGIGGEFLFLEKTQDAKENKAEKATKILKEEIQFKLFDDEENASGAENRNNAVFDNLSGVSLEIAKVLKDKPLSTEDICDLLNLGFGEVASYLTELELEGVIENINGTYHLNQ